MKTKIAALLFAVATLLTTACEQHKWSETKKLFPEAHGTEGHGHAAGEHKEGEHGHGAKAEAPHGEHKPAAPAEGHGEAPKQ